MNLIALFLAPNWNSKMPINSSMDILLYSYSGVLDSTENYLWIYTNLL